MIPSKPNHFKPAHEITRVESAHNAPEVTGHLLEPPLAVLALVSDPSAVTHARPVDALPGQAVLVARLGRRGVSSQHQVKEHADHQVSAHAAHITLGGRSGLQGKGPAVTFDGGIHSSVAGAEWRSGPFGVGGRGKPRLLRTMLLEQTSPAYSLTVAHADN